MKRLVPFLALLFLIPSAHAREAWRGFCEEPSLPVITSGLTSTTIVQVSHPLCLVTVNVHGGGLATIYSDNNNTPLTNPFSAQTNGQWIFYADNGRYDVTTTQGAGPGGVPPGFTNPITYFDILLCDSAQLSPSCAAAPTAETEIFQHNGVFVGQQQTFNIVDGANATFSVTNDVVNSRVTMTLTAASGVTWYHNEGLIATEPGGDFADGTNLTWTAVDHSGLYVTYTPRAVEQYQNNGSTVGAEPILNLIPGTNITFSPFTDAGGKINVTINATGGGSGCTLPGTNTGVLSEHPVGTCYDSANYTWDDGSNKQNLQAGLTNTQGTSLNFLFGQSLNATGSLNSFSEGNNNTQNCQYCDTFGDHNTITQIGATQPTEIHIYGESNTVQENDLAPSDVHVVGSSNNYDMDSNAASSILSVWNLGEAAQVTADNGGTVNVASIVGKQDQLLATTSTSIIAFASVMGHGSTIEGGGEWDHVVVVGDMNLLNWANFSAINSANTVVGYGNQIQDTSFSNSVGRSTLIGYGNAISGTMNYSGLFGANQTLAACSHCYVFGENASMSTSNYVGVGFSATPEIGIQAGVVALAAHLNQSATKQFAGTCSMVSGTSCTFTLLAAYTGTPVCVVSPVTATSGSVVAGACTVSSTTVTITAASSNSLAWDAVLIGNPN